jgi:hypothetical protein
MFPVRWRGSASRVVSKWCRRRSPSPPTVVLRPSTSLPPTSHTALCTAMFFTSAIGDLLRASGKFVVADGPQLDWLPVFSVSVASPSVTIAPCSLHPSALRIPLGCTSCLCPIPAVPFLRLPLTKWRPPGLDLTSLMRWRTWATNGAREARRRNTRLLHRLRSRASTSSTALRDLNSRSAARFAYPTAQPSRSFALPPRGGCRLHPSPSTPRHPLKTFRVTSLALS